jgi:signal transduction histidine kinase
MELNLAETRQQLSSALEQLSVVNQALREAEAESHAREYLLVTLSHELRTPLLPALLTTQMLEGRSDLSGEVREQLRIVRQCIEDENRLIGDMFEYSRMAAGKLELERVSIDLHALIEELVNACRLEPGRSLTTASMTATRHHVMADPMRIRQVLWNVVSNARKFTPADGKVEIFTRDAGPCIETEVRDNGVGIPSHLLHSIFKPFKQGPRIPWTHTGIGLGLAIARAIVEAHGGRISAASAGPNTGAAFTILLPLV